VEAAPQTPPDPELENLEVNQAVTVNPGADDDAIARRLQRVLDATGWFADPVVRVQEGIVFLEGGAASEQHSEWARQLARSTEDVLAVVNHLHVPERSPWNLSPTWETLQRLAAEAFRVLPLIAIGLVMLIVTWLVARWAVRGSQHLLRRRISSVLLGEVLARLAALPVFVLGAYVILKVSGLTGLALSLVGGTGLAGLVIGFALRDIAENFLASLLISIQRPFATGDLIGVAGHTGFVQRVNTRATLLMTVQGNHVQIPNATIYKETITNYTANPNERFDFAVGIGYRDSITGAQAVALQVLQEHPAVLDEPEPLVLAEQLGAATVNLRVYFWVDILPHSGPKVRSSVIRQIKRAFDDSGISMPDEAREVVFPEGVPLREPTPQAATHSATVEAPIRTRSEDDGRSNSAEGRLTSQNLEIEEQARKARLPEGGQNLLD
jgi:small-conductance mechanosensitive channel